MAAPRSLSLRNGADGSAGFWLRRRITRAADSSALQLEFASGEVAPLPCGGDASSTTFVHCTAGAFNFSKTSSQTPPPVFAEGRITVQEIFNYPGFCFNGALIAYLECRADLDAERRNALCELPPAGAPAAPHALGPVAGDVGAFGESHGLVISLRNLRRWYATPGMGEWLHGLRLFSLAMNGYSLEAGRALAERNWAALRKGGVVSEQAL